MRAPGIRGSELVGGAVLVVEQLERDGQLDGLVGEKHDDVCGGVVLEPGCVAAGEAHVGDLLVGEDLAPGVEAAWSRPASERLTHGCCIAASAGAA